MKTPWIVLILLAPLLPCAAVLMYAKGWIPTTGVLIATLTMMGIIEVTVVLSLALSGHPGKRARGPIDPAKVLYADGLITIEPGRIVFHHYGFFSSREVPVGEVHAIRALPATLSNGKWRLGGTGDFQTYFPSDFLRFRRDTIFLAEMKQSAGYRIGFTVKDSRRVREVLQGLGLLHPICQQCGYDLRASKGRCPECGAAIPADAGSESQERKA